VIQNLPKVRGKYIEAQALSDLTWFRVGGPAEVLFQPADSEDLSDFLANRPEHIPVTTIGVGSNLLVRDGGIPGVVIRLGRGFNQIKCEGNQVTAGAAALDVMVAKQAQKASIGGLEFFRGIPGTIGGALRMNAGSYGTETKDVLVSCSGFDEKGIRHEFDVSEMGFSYRHSDIPENIIFVEAIFQGHPEEPEKILARMEKITDSREASQPVRSRTGGSTFKNPDPAISDGRKAWQLIDAAGCRGLTIGGARVSDQHCNFLINEGEATAGDLENLGEEVRARVSADTGVKLQWEIRRIGKVPAQS
jgi:UDP-N-acetylmuramate dehydrogenase